MRQRPLSPQFACLLLMWGLGSGFGLAQTPASRQIPFGLPPTLPADWAALAFDEPAGGTPDAQLDGATLAVAPANREDSRLFYLAYYQNAATPASGWTGDKSACAAGTTSAAFRDAVVLRINYFRAMAGVPAQVALSDTYNAKAQQAALMMSVNGQLSHDPPATWQCYTADGDQAAANSNLALGIYGWNAITGYVQDPGTSNGAVGHRRWILYPQTQTMGTGDVPSDSGGPASNDLWVFDGRYGTARPPVRDTFVAWPPPGFVPYQVVFPRWSFSYPAADFSNASVTMTLDGQNVALLQESVKTGYGENTLVWIPSGLSSSSAWPKPAADTAYTVTVTNVLIGGVPTSFTYDVIVMDPAQPTPRPVPSDLTGDRKSDILWHHATRGEVWLWPMDGAAHTAESYVGLVGEAGWEVRGLGDQTGDGQADLLWRHGPTGLLYLWTMNGSAVESEAYMGTVEPAYDIVGTGDYNGDGRSDILWRHLTNGELWLWLMDGVTTLGVHYVDTVDPAYEVQGSGDLNADGQADIVWRHATQGDVWAWLMNGPTPAQVAYVSTVSELAYRIVGVADYTGDGKADLLWHHATRGEVWLWPMDGVTVMSETYVATVADTGVSHRRQRRLRRGRDRRTSCGTTRRAAKCGCG